MGHTLFSITVSTTTRGSLKQTLKLELEARIKAGS